MRRIYLFIFILSVSIGAAAATTPQSPELTGELIDQLMKKEAGQAKTISKVQNDESQPVFKNQEESIAKGKINSSSQIWIRMLVSLGIVLALMALAFYAFKKWPVTNKLVSKRMIEVLAQHHLGAKKSLAVVRVAGEAVLVGITDNNISILKSLSLLDDDVALPQTKMGPPPPPKKFQNSLAKEIQREEEFNMQGLREIVGDRLRSLKEL